MGFLSKLFRDQIMSPIGRPEKVTGTRPIFKDPEPMLPNAPIQPLPLVPQVRSPLQNAFDKIQNQLQPMAPPMVPPPIPNPNQKIFKNREEAEADRLGLTVEEYRAQNPRPQKIVVPRGGSVPMEIPSIGGIKNPDGTIRGGISAIPPTQDSGGGRFMSRIRDAIKQNPDIVRQGGNILGKRFDEIPLEDFGFGPGIRRSEDFFRPEEMMKPPAPVDPNEPRAGTLGGSGYGRFPLGTAGPEYLYDDAGNPIMDPSGLTLPLPVVEPNPGQTTGPVQTTGPGVDPNVGPAPVTTPTDPSMPMGAIDPVLLQQATSEVQTDPLLRSLYFGTADSPGFYNQLQQAGANLIGSDVPLQQTAGLAPLELLARQQAVAGLGGFEPFLQQNRDLVNQAISQSRRAEELQDPYYTQAEQIYQDTMGAYDPSMTQQFYNPYEDAVVQQTIEDVMKAGDQQDIAARAREISSGAFGGSRARLGAEERRQDLGEGLAKALSGIRQTGFSEAQRTGLGEFARQQQAKRTGAQGLMGIGVGRGSAAADLGQQLAGYGGQMTGLGRTQEELRRGQRGELAGFGSTGRGIAETGLSRIYDQMLAQQYRPMQTLGQIGQMLPGYQAASSKIDSQYGMPTDPTAAGLGAAFSAYGAMAPRPQQGSS